MGTNNREEAESKAREIIELVLSDRTEELAAGKLRRDGTRLRPPGIAAIGEVIVANREKAVVFLAARTITDNINAFRLLVREGLGQPDLTCESVDHLNCDVLTGRLIARFEEKRLRLAGPDEETRQSTLVTINAYARHTRSIFKEKFRKSYVRDMGLLLPDLSEFLDEELVQPARIIKEPTSNELIAKTFSESQKLRETDRIAYVVFLLGLCSLRRGEIQRMEWSWLVSSEGRFVVKIPRQSKSKVMCRND